MLLNANDPRLSWQGTISQIENAGTIKPWRLPYDQLDFFDINLLDKAAKTSGVRLNIATDASSVSLKIKLNEIGEGDFKIDLVIDNQIITTETMQQDGTVRFEQLDGQYKVIELWFPPNFGCELESVELADGATVTKVEDLRPKWVTYGSSITHCTGASSPAMTWPAIVAREKDLNLTSLGYAGQCLIDPMVASLIRDLPADIISLKLGINTHNGHFSERTFSAAIIGTITTIREKHPTTPLIVCSPIWSPPREIVSTGMSLVEMRKAIKTVVNKLQQHGDLQIYYIDGLKLFGLGNHAVLPDELHPNAAGMEILAKNFIKEVFEKRQIGVTLKRAKI